MKSVIRWGLNTYFSPRYAASTRALPSRATMGETMEGENAETADIFMDSWLAWQPQCTQPALPE